MTTLENGVFFCASKSTINLTKDDGLESSYANQIESSLTDLLIANLSGDVSFYNIEKNQVTSVLHTGQRAAILVQNPFDFSITISNGNDLILSPNYSEIVPFRSFIPLCYLTKNQVFGLLFNNKYSEFGNFNFEEFTRFNIDDSLLYQGNVQNAYSTAKNRLFLGCKDGLREIIHLPHDTSYTLIHLGEKNPFLIRE